MLLLLSKIILFFVAAIWGIVLGVLVPASMLIWEDIATEVPAYVPALWLCASVAGYIAPCVLVRLKLFKTAAALSTGGAVAVIIVHYSLSHYVVNMQFVWFYLPLLSATVATIVIAVIKYAEKIAESHDAPAPSILGKLEEINENGGTDHGTVRPEFPVSHSRKRKRKPRR
jgi:hypothetical protein